MSEFRIAILRPDGERVWLVPGRKGTLTEPGEHDLIQACTAAIVANLDSQREACLDGIVAQGVGMFRTEAQVRKAVAVGLRDFQSSIALAVEHGITEVVMAMKTAVLPKPK